MHRWVIQFICSMPTNDVLPHGISIGEQTWQWGGSMLVTPKSTTPATTELVKTAVIIIWCQSETHLCLMHPNQISDSVCKASTATLIVRETSNWDNAQQFMDLRNWHIPFLLLKQSDDQQWAAHSMQCALTTYVLSNPMHKNKHNPLWQSSISLIPHDALQCPILSTIVNH